MCRRRDEKFLVSPKCKVTEVAQRKEMEAGGGTSERVVLVVAGLDLRALVNHIAREAAR